MHHPNGPALSVNYAFDSASETGLRGKEKGHSQQGRKWPFLVLSLGTNCFRWVRGWAGHAGLCLQVAGTHSDRKHNCTLSAQDTLLLNH